MTHIEIRQKFLDFFKEKGHAIVPSSSLLPNDPSVLFTTAGMQQFKPYYTGEADPMKDFGALNMVSIQKCIRTSDIDEVGDETHLTFFEMLGNFSFGGYWKEEAIKLAYQFITQELGLTVDYVSMFGGEDEVPADKESEKIWKEVAPDIEIKKFGRTDNFWGPTGDEGPCGPTTEIYINGTEVWNIVFNQYYQKKDKTLEPLKTKGIDTGMGLERLTMMVQDKKNIFETDLFSPLRGFLPKELAENIGRIIIDHARSVLFLLSDGVLPSNRESGYILRRLMRRIFVYTHLHKLRLDTLEELMKIIFEKYGEIYPEILKNRNNTINTMWAEYEKFNKTIDHGIKEIYKLEKIDAQSAFKLYESFGLPYEIIKELGEDKAKILTREAFDEEFKKHQEISRAGSEKKFGGHGLILDTGELKAGNEEELKIVTRLHTATHLLQAALRKILGDKVHQAGSDITAEKLRFDFTFQRKLTLEEIKKVEDLVKDVIDRDLPVEMTPMDYEDAVETGALHFFKIKYPPIVNVYSIGHENNWFSRELCGGPHINHTSEIGKFKIIKEEAVSAGVRRIRAVIQ